MPTTAKDLINGRSPVTTHPNASLVEALAIMREHDYSQLPVVELAGKKPKLVSAESILRAQTILGASYLSLNVSDAVSDARTVAPDDEVSVVFEHFNKSPAVLVVDGSSRLLGIITPWDAAAHFQQRAEDIMLVEDIENYLKDHIQAAYAHPDALISLEEAISALVDRRDEALTNVVIGLKQYLGRVGIKHDIKADIARRSFHKIIDQSFQSKTFDELAMGQYIQLLLSDASWKHYGKTFNLKKLEKENLSKMLDDVREIRNQLSHFRGELTREQRITLKYCSDFFKRHPHSQTVRVESGKLDFTGGDIEVSMTGSQPTERQYEDELEPGESRYARLSLHLERLSQTQQTSKFTFGDVEKIIGGDLPKSAFEHRAWWANDSESHVQSRQWLDAGWKVTSVSLMDKAVTFTRSDERKRMYIDFFSTLMNQLKQQASFAVRDANPNGSSWTVVASLPDDMKKQSSGLVYAFTRKDRFRVELYIDTGDGEKNKQIFDRLAAQKDQIEDQIGANLEWERLNTKRGSRIALYTSGNINNDAERLSALRDWAVSTMIRFEQAIAGLVGKAQQGIF